MSIFETVKSKMLSRSVEAKERKVGVEIESFYYRDKDFLRIPVNSANQYSASSLLNDISKEKGCYLSRLSGSGSVCYGVFDNEKGAKKALNKIKRRYPRFWFSIAKTV